MAAEIDSQLFLKFWQLTPYEFRIALEGYRRRKMNDLRNQSLNTAYIVNTIRGILSKNPPLLSINDIIGVSKNEIDDEIKTQDEFNSFEEYWNYCRKLEIEKIKKRYSEIGE